MNGERPWTLRGFLTVPQGTVKETDVTDIVAALREPQSTLSQELDELTSWVEEHFSLRNLLSSDLIKSRLNPRADQIVDKITHFLLACKANHALNEDEVDNVIRAGTIHHDPATKLSNDEYLLAASRMIEYLIMRHPELVASAHKQQSRGR